MSLLESVAVAHQMVEVPELVGSVADDSILSCATTVQSGGVLSTFTEVETSSARTWGTCTSKKSPKPSAKTIAPPRVAKIVTLPRRVFGILRLEI